MAEMDSGRNEKEYVAFHKITQKGIKSK